MHPGCGQACAEIACADLIPDVVLRDLSLAPLPTGWQHLLGRWLCTILVVACHVDRVLLFAPPPPYSGIREALWHAQHATLALHVPAEAVTYLQSSTGLHHDHQ